MGSLKLWVQDFLGIRKEITPSDAIYSRLANAASFKELAIYIAVSYVANTLSKCEFKVYENGVPVKNDLYYKLNVSPNVNQNSSQFMNKFIENYFYDGEALVVQHNNSLYCADGFNIKDGGANPLKEFIFTDVQFGSYSTRKEYLARDVFYFKLDNKKVKSLIDSLYLDYGEVLATAIKAYKRSNGNQYKLIVDSPPAGDEAFRRKAQEALTKQLKNFMENDNVVYQQNKGQTLERMNTGTPKDTADLVAMRKEIFDITAQAFKIPLSMMYGNITNMNEIVKVFLSIAIDPIADMIGEEITRTYYSMDEWKRGCRVELDTSCINHVDILDVGDGIDKAISSGVACIDEVRERLGKQPLDNELGRSHFITKNYGSIEDMLKHI